MFRTRLYSRLQRAFTLVELLVVMVVIAMLLALLMPAVNRVRESARKTQCADNLHQIGLAMANHEVSLGYFPSSWRPSTPTTNATTGAVSTSGWSAFGQILPHLEQGNLYKNINFDLSYNLAPNVTTADGVSTKLTSMRIPTFVCPSEVRDEPKMTTTAPIVPAHYPPNYAVNAGTWFVYDQVTGAVGNGAFYPKSKLTAAAFSQDGLSNTLCVSEVKAWQYQITKGNYATTQPMPATPADAVALNGTINAGTGHTEWVDGHIFETTFTTTFAPNTVVPYTPTASTTTYDVDWVNASEGNATNYPTFGAVTSRSYHASGVNVVMMDGTVRSIASDINLGVWQALSTRNGGELLPKY